MRKDYCLCFNDCYVPYACVTIQSIMQHSKENDEIVIHVLYDYLSDENIRFLKGYDVEFHIINERDKKILEGINTSIWSVYSLYRFFLPYYLSNVNKVLYLDCDVIVNSDLDELFGMDMGGVAVGGCIDLQTYSEEVFTRLDYEYNKKYICSGVLLMNLDYWRSYKLSTKIIDFMKKNSDKIKFPDQDALNYLCRDNKIVLEALYGVQTLFFLHKDFMIEHMEEMRMLIDKPSIVHYAGYPPWVYCKNKSMHSYLWWNTYKKLNAFHKVKRDYILSIAKYICRYLFSTLHIISCNNKYHINQYYNHPRVKKNRVEKELKVLNQH